MFLLLGVAACGTTTSPRIEVPASLRASCVRPDGADEWKLIGDLAAYSIRQDAALKVCDAKREALVSIIDAAKPARPWWRP